MVASLNELKLREIKNKFIKIKDREDLDYLLYLYLTYLLFHFIQTNKIFNIYRRRSYGNQN